MQPAPNADWGSVRERTDTVWLRVADAARLLGVSANTVRRWTDAGRLAAHRSPGGHRRYRADDVLALLPAEGPEGAPKPGDIALLRRESEYLQAVVDDGLELTRILTEAPRVRPLQVAPRHCGR
jgi:excisionase family DNA binding protein